MPLYPARKHIMDDSFSPSRLEAFSDGVIAVIITIMVLELHVPAQHGLAGFMQVLPTIGVYALSFTFVGIFWVNHHLLIHRIREASPRILWANLVWLFCLSLLPFLTAYVSDERYDSFSVALYAASLVVTGMGFMLLRLAVMARQRAEGTIEHSDLALLTKHWGSVAIYVIAIPVAYWHATYALYLIGLVTAIWIIPTLGVERCEETAKHHPHKH
jgi:uncharacterized membrane protein